MGEASERPRDFDNDRYIDEDHASTEERTLFPRRLVPTRQCPRLIDKRIHNPVHRGSYFAKTTDLLNQKVKQLELNGRPRKKRRITKGISHGLGSGGD